jgi:deoxycytidylate deaminase
MASQAQNVQATDNSKKQKISDLSPSSQELILAISGFVGSGCSAISGQMEPLLAAKGYDVSIIKISQLIETECGDIIPNIVTGVGKGASKLARATALQNAGDKIREDIGNFALAAYAVEKIKKERGSSTVGSSKKAFIIDSIKHPAEIELLRNVYGSSFRLIAIHCDIENRKKRLIGDVAATVKFPGVSENEVLAFMERDENDAKMDHGQHVKDVFYRADFFLDNSQPSPVSGGQANPDLDRFFDLILGNKIHRPKITEKAMYFAFGVAAQSSCLSRQVGACLISPQGQIVALGTNDPPKFGGGIYTEDDHNDARCQKFQFNNGVIDFVGCHNDRKKKELRDEINDWASRDLVKAIAAAIYDENAEASKYKNALKLLQEGLSKIPSVFERMPGIKNLIEFSRSIHAEMDALLSAAREGHSTVGCDLYVTTYPCHGCARHLVAAGIRKVFFIEPYSKSLALELHSDAITTALPAVPGPDNNNKMVIQPFTGVGPTMYKEVFVKRSDLKKSDGVLDMPANGIPDSTLAVRLNDLKGVEEKAVALVRLKQGDNDKG